MDRLQFLLVLSVVVGGLVQALKTERLQGAFRLVFKVDIPKKALPWIALVLGAAGTLTEAGLRGEPYTFYSVIRVLLEGFMSGGFAVAGAETVAKLPGSGKAPPLLVLLFLFGGSFVAVACGPEQRPCVDAYKLARTEAEIAEVDKECGYLLLGGGGEGGGK